MDDLDLLRGLGRDLEHEPPGSLARQRARLLEAAHGRTRAPCGPVRRPRGPVRWPRRPGRWTLFGAVAAVTAALILVPAVLLGGGGVKPPVIPSSNPFAARTGPLNVLVVGSDRRAATASDGAEEARSDTLLLVHLPADRKSAHAVSFPRDLLVQIPSCQGRDGKPVPSRRGQINAAYSLGGHSCARKTIEALTGVRVDTTVVVEFAGFRTMVDALGGVPITLPTPVDDQATGLRLPAGRHLVQGTQALAYVRLRHGIGDGSDLSRVERQQRFMASMLRRAKETRLRNPARFARFLSAAAGSVATYPRLDVAALKALADSMGGTDPGAVRFGTVPVVPAPDDPARVVWDREKAMDLFTQLREGG
ncbi:LCP family protein [Actinomadura fibrosa]|uniref:LCP family protein n=1 Tax=Actinomadura fibrosa TaxID=111802 RepID=A0ABW2Y1W1_9ACTN|nr:LCP family protein [Actinomadura fibrosa]